MAAAQTTLDQAIVALLRLRRRDVPGDTTLDQAAILQFGYAQQATPVGEDVALSSSEGTVFTPKDAMWTGMRSSHPMTSPMTSSSRVHPAVWLLDAAGMSAGTGAD